MSKTLIVLEKKKVYPKFQAALENDGGKFKVNERERFMENENYVVTWLEGHCIGLKEPKDYEEVPKLWNEIPLPWKPESFEYKVRDPKEADGIKDTKKREEIKKALQRKKDIFFSVSKQMKRPDISLMINACDAEREGELIFWEMYDYLGLGKKKVPVKRFFESTVLNPPNIRKIMANGLKEEEFYQPRRLAAYARAYADLLLGMNMTVGFSVKAKAGRQLNMGRVITPLIAILVNRENEILNFVSQHYFEVDADFGKYKGKWFKEKLSETRIEKKEDVQTLVEKIKGKIGTVTKKDVAENRIPHELFYSMTALVSHANRKFGYDGDTTLKIAQQLYDERQLTSYPRTSSKYIRSGNLEDIEPTLRQIAKINEYKGFAEKALEAWKTKAAKLERVINDKDTSDHHAIIPLKDTEPKFDVLSEPEKNIYDLILRRFLSAFYPPALYEKTDVITEVEGETFKTSGRILIDPGWKVIYGTDHDEEEEEEEKNKNKKEKDVKLPPIEHGEKNKVANVETAAKETQPPKRYTEGELADLMETPSKLLNDEELKKVIKESGIGTDATRPSHLKKIKDVKYVTVEKKRLIPTPIAMELIKIAPDELKSPIITAEWEAKLRDVEIGKYPFDKFMTEIEGWIDKNIKLLANINASQIQNTASTPADAEVIGKCPDCGSDVIKRKVNVKDKKTGKTSAKIVYSCVNHSADQKCFTFWEQTFGKKISVKYVKELLKNKETSEISFEGKNGPYSAKIKWNTEEKNIEPIYSNKKNGAKKSEITCPFCGEGHITENSKAFGCSNFRNQCTFTIWKNDSVQLNFSIIEDLIKDGKSKKITDFKRNGKTYTATLVVDDKEKKIKVVY